MNQISKDDKKRIIDFIMESDLDYNVIDNDISKFGLVSDDGYTFYVFSYNENFIIGKYDPEKDKQGKECWEYFEFKTISQMLEQLSFYDKSLPKVYWSPTLNSIEVPFDKNTYTDEWVNEFLSDGRWKVEESNCYKYLAFEDDSYKPEIKSPFNTLHEVSEINKLEYTKVEKLSFEIHPVSLEPRKESYFLKLLCNNEEIMKEFINYEIVKKRGLKLFLEDMFNTMSKFKVGK